MKKDKDVVSDIHVDVELHLQQIVASQGFANSARMQAFLTYVVKESLAGRGEEILGKTIARDVYDREASADGDTDNVVRVDARRLRRCLAEYYESEGRDDQLRIHIDSGGYTPRFELTEYDAAVEESAGSLPVLGKSGLTAKTPLIVAAILAGVTGVALSLAFLFGGSETDQTSADSVARKKTLERQALLEKSQTTLQAANLAEQGFGMMYPLFDAERQKLATDVFKQVIRLDPEYFEGYVGAAQTLASLAILVPQEYVDFLSEAKTMSDNALALNPAHARVQSSAAWVAFAGKNYGRAVELSTRAAEISPRDGFVLDNHGLIMLFTGDFEAAVKATDPALRKDFKTPRSGYRNIHAAANFHLGFYKRTLDLFDQIGPDGGPVSPPTLAYRAAAFHALGEMQKASEEAEELNDTWPGAQVGSLLSAFFRNPDHVRTVIDRLMDAGWKKGE